jgi:NADH-quinone oxidoreductase subunit C
MTAERLVEAIRDGWPDAVVSAHSYRGDATLIVRREHLLGLARTLKESPTFLMSFLMDLTAVDFSAFGTRRPPGFFDSSGVAARPSPQIPDRERWGRPSGARFVVVYHFFSLPLKHRLRLEVPVEEDDAEVDSLTPLWPGANWLEREVWDMFGIRFRGHPNLTRILMYEAFVGHPLRKDYPVNRRQPLIGPIDPRP